MRVIQPARVQDVASAYYEMWEVPEVERERVKEVIYAIHEKMRLDGLLIDVRRGTYILTAKGMEIAGKFVKERELDNRRLFLMKRQRRLYH